MKIYIAGKMRGVKFFNFPAFFSAEKELIKQGHTVFNPARKDIQKYGKTIVNKKGDLEVSKKKGFDLRKALADDTRWICLHADGIALLPGWKQSKGARAERALAKALGLKVFKLKGKKYTLS